VPPDGALLLASVLYIAVLIAACLMVRPQEPARRAGRQNLDN